MINAEKCAKFVKLFMAKQQAKLKRKIDIMQYSKDKSTRIKRQMHNGFRHGKKM